MNAHTGTVLQNPSEGAKTWIGKSIPRDFDVATKSGAARVVEFYCDEALIPAKWSIASGGVCQLYVHGASLLRVCRDTCSYRGQCSPGWHPQLPLLDNILGHWLFLTGVLGP